MKTNEQLSKDEVSLKELIEKGRDWLDYLLSQWRMIVIAGFIGATLGLIYSISKKPVYTATLSFALEDDKTTGSLGGALGLASSLGFDLGGSGGSIFSSSNLAELFKSRSMVERTLLTPVIVNGKVISLAEMYIQNEEWRDDDDWEDEPEIKNIQFLPDSNRKGFSRAHDSILGVIYKNISKQNLSVSQKDKKVDIISMDVFSTNELFAKYFCEALAKQVGQFYIATKSKKARLNMDILKKQLDSIRGELNGAITGVAVANDRTFNLNPALNVKRTPSVKRQVDMQANTAILTELVKQTELAKVTLRKETPLIQVVDRPILPLNKVKFGKLKGIIIGGFFSGFLVIAFLVFKRIFKDILSR